MGQQFSSHPSGTHTSNGGIMLRRRPGGGGGAKITSDLVAKQLPPFLSLPGEVRNHIYSYLLRYYDDPVVFYRVHDDVHRRYRRFHEPNQVAPTPICPDGNGGLLAQLLPLFLTNRQVSLEARTYFYSHNLFSVPSAAAWPLNWGRLPLVMRWFVGRIGPHNARALRHLCIPFPLESERYVEWAGSDAQSPEGRRRPLIPGLAAACPGLATLEFEPRSSSRFEEYMLTCQPEAHARTMRTIAAALRDEFPALQMLVVHLWDFVPVDMNHWSHTRAVWSEERARQMSLDFRAVLRDCGWMLQTADHKNRAPAYTVVYSDGPSELRERVPEKGDGDKEDQTEYVTVVNRGWKFKLDRKMLLGG